jgi:hypothetical protein
MALSKLQYWDNTCFFVSFEYYECIINQINMEKLIACCGLDCAACDARKATINNDNDLREKTANLWRMQYNNDKIMPEMINCTGCTEPGAKFGHCSECEIANCVKSKALKNCAECTEIKTCVTINQFFHYVPEAKENLGLMN